MPQQSNRNPNIADMSCNCWNKFKLEGWFLKWLGHTWLPIASDDVIEKLLVSSYSIGLNIGYLRYQGSNIQPPDEQKQALYARINYYLRQKST